MPEIKKLRLSGCSMYPILRTGDCCYYMPVDNINDIEIGDIVVYKQCNQKGDNEVKGLVQVVHRLIDKKENYLITKGDNSTEKEYVKYENLLGKVIIARDKTGIIKKEPRIRKYFILNYPGLYDFYLRIKCLIGGVKRKVFSEHNFEAFFRIFLVFWSVVVFFYSCSALRQNGMNFGSAPNGIPFKYWPPRELIYFIFLVFKIWAIFKIRDITSVLIILFGTDSIINYEFSYIFHDVVAPSIIKTDLWILSPEIIGLGVILIFKKFIRWYSKIIAIFIGFTLSSVFSINFYRSFVGLGFVVLGLMLFLAIINKEDPLVEYKFMEYLIFPYIVLAWIGVIKIIYGWVLFHSIMPMRLNFSGINQEYIVWYFSLIFPIVLGMSFSFNGLKRKWYFLNSLLIYLDILASYSLAGFFGGLIGALFVLKRKINLRYVFIALIVFSLFSSMYISKIKYKKREFKSGRLIEWKIVLNTIKDGGLGRYIFGYGTGNNWIMRKEAGLSDYSPANIYELKGLLVSAAHSFPLEIMLGSGLLGIISLVLFFITPLNVESKESHIIGIKGGFLSVTIVSMFHSLIGKNTGIPLILFLLAGMLMRRYQKKLYMKNNVIIFVAICFLFFVSIGNYRLKSNIESSLIAKSNIDKAIKIDPYQTKWTYKKALSLRNNKKKTKLLENAINLDPLCLNVIDDYRKLNGENYYWELYEIDHKFSNLLKAIVIDPEIISKKCRKSEWKGIFSQLDSYCKSNENSNAFKYVSIAKAYCEWENPKIQRKYIKKIENLRERYIARFGKKLGMRYFRLCKGLRSWQADDNYWKEWAIFLLGMKYNEKVLKGK